MNGQLIIEKNVVICGLKDVMQPTIKPVVQIFNDYGYQCRLTSALDGKHKKYSKHPLGEALDFGLGHIKSKSVRMKIFRDIKQVLGVAYDVVFEGNHIHVEFDVYDGYNRTAGPRKRSY